jgi:hypothetical protein
MQALVSVERALCSDAPTIRLTKARARRKSSAVSPGDSRGADGAERSVRPRVQLEREPSHALPHELGATSARAARLALFSADAIGWFLVAIGLWHTFVDLWLPIQYYDEGILLTDANLILRGEIPYRDFYSNYPPGIFLVIAALWKLGGVSVLAYRALGFLLHVFVAALAGRLAARVSGRRFMPLAAGLALIWIEGLEGAPSAYLAAIALGLAFVELALRATERASSRVRPLLAGLALGAVSCFRHDLFAYLVLAIGALSISKRFRSELFGAGRGRWIGAGCALVLAAFWSPVLLAAGFARVADDLFIAQVRYVLPARALPIPSLFAPTRVASLDLALPAFAADLVAGGVVLALLGLLAGVFLARSERGIRLAVALAIALSAASIAHMLGRTDQQHVLYAAAPAIVLVIGSGEALVRRASRSHEPKIPRVIASAAALALGVLWLVIPARASVLPIRSASFGATPDETLPRYFPLHAEHVEERRAALEFIAENTSRDDPIFVGLWSHRRAMGNDLDIYFLADRRGATRYMQFDPNVVTRADVQQAMIGELERTRPKVGILTALEVWYEPNRSSELGSSLLDDYLHAHYRVARRIGTYRLILRK